LRPAVAGQTIAFHLEGVGTGTRVTFVHTGLGWSSVPGKLAEVAQKA
jgi:hypothetical protein